MATIHISAFGKYKKAELIRETPKGFRVKEQWGPGHFVERIYYRQCPHGNHRAFEEKSQALDNAEKWIGDQEDVAKAVLERCGKKRSELPSAAPDTAKCHVCGKDSDRTGLVLPFGWVYLKFSPFHDGLPHCPECC